MASCHREDGPAIEYVSIATKQWYIDGKLSSRRWPCCGNGPMAVGFGIFNDKLHREDGPAVESVNGCQRWYLNGKEMSESEHLQAVLLAKWGLTA